MTLRPALLALLLVLAGAVGGGLVLAAQALLPGARAGDVRGYLLAHPEVLPEAMTRLREREASKFVAANRAAIVAPFPGAVGGNPAGGVTVAVYMDYACTFCHASLPALAQLVKADPNVRVVYRELPILGEDSITGAAWALAAAEQGKYLPFHEALFSAGRPSAAAIQAAATSAGLDQARARATVASPQVAAEFDKNRSMAGGLGVTGTPAWVIGDRVLSGALSYDELAAAVKAAR